MITRITLKNFKLFSDEQFEFNPEFNLIVGVNGSGKSTLLKGLAISLAGWAHAYIKDRKNLRPIEDNEIREIEQDGRFDKTKKTSISAHGIFPIISRLGYTVNGMADWTRYRAEGEEQTFFTGGIRYESRDGGSYSEKEYPLNLSTLGSDVMRHIEQGKQFDLPVIAFYECDRLWMSEGDIDVKNTAMKQYSRFEPYVDCFHTGVNDKALVEWLLKLELAALQKKTPSPLKSAIEMAAKGALENCIGFGFDFEESRVMVRFEDGTSTPFEHLSDGQRTILGLFCDIARRAAILNPHLGESICHETKGVILIDELDLHLHPKWQRVIIEALRTTFPSIQFICTTHSPFLIQSLRSGNEIIKMDGEPLLEFKNKSIEDISINMGVEHPATSRKYRDMKEAAKSFMQDLSEVQGTPRDKQEEFKKRLASITGLYAENPAYQAFLELQYLSKFRS
ncbi:TPA: AAA family ATPase [Vibrio parahaemolyticus]|nr:AAA family ATPase [Vibrio parahaemolyticus]